MMPVQGKQRYGDRDWAAFGGYVLGSYLEALNTNATVTRQTDHIFADDEREANPTSFKSLQMAHAWRSPGSPEVPAPSRHGYVMI